MKSAFAAAALLFLALACGVPQEQFDAMASDLVSAQERISELQNASTVTTSVVLALERDVAELQIELGKSDSFLSEANADLENVSDELARKELTIATLSSDLETRGDVIEGLQQEVADLQDVATKSAIAILALNETLANKEAAFQDSLQEVVDLGLGLTLANAANADLQRQVEVLQAKVDDGSSEAIQADIKELKSQRDALAAKVSLLATLVEQYTSDPDVETTSSGLACTGSMLPLLHCGDIVIMQTNLKHRDIQEGDIISFRRRDCTSGRSVTDSITLHRVVDIDAGWFVTQGDNNYTVDSCRLPLINVTGKLLSYIEDIYPEHYMETANYEAIKTQYNDMQGRFDRDLAAFQEQQDLLDDAENDYKDGYISYSRYVQIWEDTEDDRLALLEMIGELNDVADTFFALQDLIIERNYNDADWSQLVN